MQIRVLRVLVIMLVCFLFGQAEVLSQNTITKEKLQGVWVSKDGDILAVKGDSCLSSLSYEVGFHHYVIVLNEVYAYSKWDTLKLKVIRTNDSLIISDRISMPYKWMKKTDDFNPMRDTLFTATYYKIQSSFSNNFHFKSISRADFPDFEVDSNGDFYHGYSTTTHVALVSREVKAHSIIQGTIPQEYLGWLKYFLNRCKWDSLKSHYEPQMRITDLNTEGFYIALTNKKYSINDYGHSAPHDLKSAMDFLDNLSELVGCGYIKSSPVAGNHFFDAALARMGSKQDSIKYLRQFDSINYNTPIYPGGIKEMLNTLRKFNANANGVTQIEFDCFINADGTFKAKDIEARYGDRGGALGKNIEVAISKLKNFQPAVYKGNKVSFEIRISVDFTKNELLSY